MQLWINSGKTWFSLWNGRFDNYKHRWKEVISMELTWKRTASYTPLDQRWNWGNLGEAEFKTSSLEVEIAIAKLKKYKSPGIDQIPAELIQVGGKILRFEIQKVINYTWNTEELHDQWKESIIVPIHRNYDKCDCSNYRGISLLSTCKILSSLRLSQCIDELIWDHQCGFWCNGSATDQIFCIHQILQIRIGNTMRQNISCS
jgi:hypothetical protein